MRRRHVPVPDQGRWLRSVLNGHLNYYAVPGNKKSIDTFRTEVMRGWFRAFRRRSQKARKLTWERFKRLVKTVARFGGHAEILGVKPGDTPGLFGEIKHWVPVELN